jgi:O-antigen/teichoic acid export membrane protein
VQVGVIISVLLITESVLALAITYLTVSVVMGITTYYFSVRALKIHNDPTHHDATIGYAKHMSILGGLQLITGQIDQFLLWHFAGPVALATYAIAQGPSRELRMISDNVAAIALPKIAQKERQDARASVTQKSRQLFIIYFFIAGSYAVAAPYLFGLLFPQYTSAVLPSQILAFGLLFQSRSLADIFFLSHGNVGDRYRITLPSQIARIILMCSLIPMYGLYGAVIATFASEAVSALAIAYTYKRSHSRI